MTRMIDWLQCPFMYIVLSILVDSGAVLSSQMHPSTAEDTDVPTVHLCLN
jgi:hypothetical protein